MKFGFVGLGQMGAPMARNLAKAHDVAVYGSNADVLVELAANGAAAVSGPESFSDVEALILCLPSGHVVQSVLFDSNTGLAQHLKPGAIVVDTSTTEYASTLEIHKRLEALGLAFLDAPVSGMRKRAEEGTLTMMIGGDANLVERLRDALSSMATKFLYTGDIGSGQLMKLINQLLFDINSAALAEILPLASKLGIDPEQVGEVVNSGTGRSYASEFLIPHILNGCFDSGYPMGAAYKDLISGADISARFKIPTLMRPKAEGGYLERKGLVEAISCLTPEGEQIPYDIRKGVWVVFEADTDYLRNCFEEYKVVTDPSGKYMTLYKRWHLIGLELAISIAAVALRGEATGAAICFNADVASIAKRDLSAGEVLDGDGGYTVSDGLRPAEISVGHGCVPLGLAHNVPLIRPVNAGAAITWEDIKIDPNSDAFQLRKGMETQLNK